MNNLTATERIAINKIRVTLSANDSYNALSGINKKIYGSDNFRSLTGLNEVTSKVWRNLFGFSIQCGDVSVTSWNDKVHTAQFNMPPVETCPGCTPICSGQVSPALKKSLLEVGIKPGYCDKIKMYPNVIKMLQRNYAATKDGNFITDLQQCCRIYQMAGGEWFRYHSYGDIYSQCYLDALSWVSSGVKLRFLAHTKSHWLNFSRLPGNFQVYLSLFPDSDLDSILDASERHNLPLAFAGEREHYASSPALQALHDRALQCPGACNDCRECWYGRRHVKFRFH